MEANFVMISDDHMQLHFSDVELDAIPAVLHVLEGLPSAFEKLGMTFGGVASRAPRRQEEEELT